VAGGWCSGLQDCYWRSQSVLGSSLNWTLHPLTVNGGPDWNVGIYGLLGNDTANHFNDWTGVFVRYCDGSSYSSYRAEPVPYNGQQLFFRGHNILTAIVDELLTVWGLAQATDVILSGTSAGAPQG
jgi:hypothetical protein